MTEVKRLDQARSAVMRRIAGPLYRAVLATTGRRLQVPIRFRALEAFGGQFDASAEAARRVLAREELDVIEHAPGRTSVRVLALDYRDIDLLAPYRELAIALPVRYRDADHDDVEGSFVLQMPVTTEEARWGGVELYGFPKILASVQMASEDGTRVATIHADRRRVLTLRVDETEGAEGRACFHNYTVRGDHQLVESTFEIEGEIAMDEGRATIELGDHPIAAQLRRMEIDTDAKTRLYIPCAPAVLSRGRPLAHVAHAESWEPSLLSEPA